MADKTRQIGNIVEKVNTNGKLFTLKLFVTSANKTAYTPTSAKKAPIPGQDGNTYISGNIFFPTATYGATYIYEYSFSPCGDHWILTIEACSSDYDWGLAKETLTISDGGIVNRSFEQTFIFFPAKWWGIVAFKNLANLYDDFVKTGITTIKVADNISGGTRSAKNASDLVFQNATVASPSGSVNYAYASDMPFIASDMPIAWVNQRVPTIKYTVTMYRATTSPFSSYLAWNGVNGGFTPPSGCSPGNGYESTGQWRKLDQKIKEHVKLTDSSSPKYYDEVIRVMELAPGALRWDAEKVGGSASTWSW